ncbi:LysR family transcriptional regulator [Klebsiella michiganensis]|uniref:LysR family transcriptional regulator n=1 Tax=Klebsiella michiganensis TaxID=1134687 RepID=A0A7H4N8V1_9ENTR|nr:LysR family transcriptional regulator [Klebsiella michiganensis]
MNVCKVILEVLEDANREASDVQKTPKGLLRVAAPVAFGAMHLGRIVSRYLEQFPEVSLDVVLEDKYAIYSKIESMLPSELGVLRIRHWLRGGWHLAGCFVRLTGVFEKTWHTRDAGSSFRAPRLAFSQAVSAGDWTIYDAQGRPHSIEGPCRMTANNIQLLLESVLAGTGIALRAQLCFWRAY